MVVGVSAYQDQRYRLTYADKDANDLADYLETRKENFNQVQLVRLVNQDATRDNILKAKQLLRQSKVDDQVIVFFAGHGLLDDKLDYYFATVDMDFSKPSAKGLSYEAIEDLLDGIPAQEAAAHGHLSFGRGGQGGDGGSSCGKLRGRRSQGAGGPRLGRESRSA